MTNQINLRATIRLVPIILAVLIDMQIAHAKECSAVLPSNPHVHWSYRFIDGRKCWYEGENNFLKSLLHWPEQTSALSPSLPPLSEDLPFSDNDQSLVEEDSVSAPFRAKPTGSPDGGTENVDSFEARWRGLETTLVKN